MAERKPLVRVGGKSKQLPAGDSLSKSVVGLGNVTNDAQAKASIYPNTTPAAGRILVGQTTGKYESNAMAGDATISESGLLTIGNGAVTNAKQGHMAARTIKGNKYAANVTPQDLTPAEARSVLGLGTAAVVDTGTGPSNAILGNDPRLSDARTPTAHSHAIADVTDLTGALATKQNTLISGTNIKTINGGSVLGGGDISTPLPFRNKIINGDFRINQRVYASGAATIAGRYTIDRWKVTGTGGVTFSTTDNKTTVTIPSGQTLQQVIEGLNLQTGTYVLSWEGTAQGRIAGGSYGASGAVTASITGGVNTTIEFNAGTVANVQLEVGSVATPFEHRPYGTELALCQRYYEKSYDIGTAPGTITDIGAVGTRQIGVNIVFDVVFFARKRAIPSITYYNPVTGDAGTWRDRNANTNISVQLSSGTAISESRAPALLATTAGNLVNGHWAADIEL